MHDYGFTTIIAYLAAAIIAVPVFKKLGLGAILGYLVAGAVLGPQGLHIIQDPESALHIAELGVVMLLFIIGLELNPEKLWGMRSEISVIGGGQLMLSACAIALAVALVFNFSWQLAIIIGLTLGLSSTAFAIQLMDEQGIMGLTLGRKGFAILLLQDMAVIPVLLLVGFWAPSSVEQLQHGAASYWWSGPLAVLLLLTLGRYMVEPCLKIIARSGSKEVLTAASLFIVLGTAVLMQWVGLSMGMGAFLAGIILANSSFRHALEADIEPFKGLLLGLFFIAVGMTLDLSLLFSQPLLILALALLLMLIKTLIIVALLMFTRTCWRDAILLGLMLSQGGEFAFVIMTKGLSLNVVEQSVADYVVLVVGISMALTPLLVMFAKQLVSKADSSAEQSHVEDENAKVVIAGFGRFGQIVGRILQANGIHFTALDKDASHVDFLKKFGNKTYFGDACRMELLRAAGIEKAEVLVVAVDDQAAITDIVKTVKEAYPHITIVARSHNRMHSYELYAAGVKSVIRETFESSMVAAEDTLLALGFTDSQAIQKVELFRNHDRELLQKAIAHRNNVDELMAIAKEGRKELADLFKQDSEIHR